MTSREIFDAVKAHLLAQKRRATEDDVYGSKCVFRTANGLKCAVGCLIPDELYDPILERCALHVDCKHRDSGGILVGKPEAIRRFNGVMRQVGIDEKQYPLLYKLTTIHDLYTVDTWEEKLDELEKTLSL